MCDKWYYKLIFRQLSKYGKENGWEDSYIAPWCGYRERFLYDLTYREVRCIKGNFEELCWKPQFIEVKGDEVTDHTEEMIPFLVEWLERDFGKLEYKSPPAVSKKCEDTAREILEDLGVTINTKKG